MAKTCTRLQPQIHFDPAKAQAHLLSAWQPSVPSDADSVKNNGRPSKALSIMHMVLMNIAVIWCSSRLH